MLGQYEPYDTFSRNMFDRLMEKRNQNDVITVHQQTCPECKRTLVNLYRIRGEWKCRRCHGIK